MGLHHDISYGWVIEENGQYVVTGSGRGKSFRLDAAIARARIATGAMEKSAPEYQEKIAWFRS
jgi:hypothetical protein